MISIEKAGAYALGVALIFAGGMAVGWKVYGPRPGKVETNAPAQRQSDGSLVLQKAPDAQAKPAQRIPAGGRVERIVQVVVQPSAAATDPTPGGLPPAGGAHLGAIPCPPVRVDLTLVKMPDGLRRVVASSPDGVVTGGVDIPVEDAPRPAPRELRWSAMGLVGYDTFRQRRVYGCAVAYTKGPFALTAGALDRSVFVGAGVRF